MEDLQLDTQRSTGEEELTGGLWPSSNYKRQIEALKKAIGKEIFLVELKPGSINLGIRMSDTAYQLLGVIDFPKPDPEKGIAPHLLLLDDGRGINLGRIARVTVNTPFSPATADILYQDAFLMKSLLTRDRQLTKASIAARSKALLGRLLGKAALKQVGQSASGTSSPLEGTSDNKQKKRLEQ